MNFVADESVDKPIVDQLRKNQHDVFFIAEKMPGAKDDFILQFANDNKCILITQDKDFGELIYRLQQIHSGVILIRLEGIKPKSKAEIVFAAIKQNENELTNSFTVIQKHLVRIRKH